MVTHEVTCAELAIVFPVSAVEVGMLRSLQHILLVWRPHVCALTEAEIKGEGFFTIDANRGMIHCLEFERARVTSF